MIVKKTGSTARGAFGVIHPDPADDGPEIDLIRFFDCHPNGTIGGIAFCKWRGAGRMLFPRLRYAGRVRPEPRS